MVFDGIIGFFARLSLIDAYLTLGPLIAFVAGVVVYFVFMFELYEFISRRDPFKLINDTSHPVERIGAALGYVLLFPAITFIWFYILASLLATLVSGMATSDIFLFAATLTISMRITSGIDERLSREVARLIPLTLIAAAILEVNNISLQGPARIFDELPMFEETLFYYFILILVIEFAMKSLVHYKEEYSKTHGPDDEQDWTTDIENIKLATAASQTPRGPTQKEVSIEKEIEFEKAEGPEYSPMEERDRMYEELGNKRKDSKKNDEYKDDDD